MMPRTKTRQDTTVLMYLKVSLISVCPVHMGGDAERGRPPAAPPPLGSAAGREALGSAPRSAGVPAVGGTTSTAAGGLCLPGPGGRREPSPSAATRQLRSRRRRRRRAGSRHRRAAGMALRHGRSFARRRSSAPTCAERGDREAVSCGDTAPRRSPPCLPPPGDRCRRCNRQSSAGAKTLGFFFQPGGGWGGEIPSGRTCSASPRSAPRSSLSPSPRRAEPSRSSPPAAGGALPAERGERAPPVTALRAPAWLSPPGAGCRRSPAMVVPGPRREEGRTGRWRWWQDPASVSRSPNPRGYSRASSGAGPPPPFLKNSTASGPSVTARPHPRPPPHPPRGAAAQPSPAQPLRPPAPPCRPPAVLRGPPGPPRPSPAAKRSVPRDRAGDLPRLPSARLVSHRGGLRQPRERILRVFEPIFQIGRVVDRRILALLEGACEEEEGFSTLSSPTLRSQ